MTNITSLTIAILLGLLVAVPGTAFVQPGQAALGDPEVIIYRFPGVLDDGGASGVGVATVFHCTNFSGAPEQIRVVTRGFAGTLTTNVVSNVSHLQSAAFSTHPTAAYVTVSLSTGTVEGTTAIAATSTNIIARR